MQTRKPQLSDLEESGIIGPGMNWVAILYEVSTRKAKTKGSKDAKHMNLLIANERLGISGEVALFFWPKYGRFESVGESASIPEG